MNTSYLGISYHDLQEKGAINTAKEIACQPELWLKVWENINKKKNDLWLFLEGIYATEDLNIILTGAGTSAFLGDVLEGHFQKYTGIKTSAIATTELVTHPGYYLQKEKPMLLISFARSGNSPESVKAVELANKICKNVYHLVITCNSGGKLAKTVTGENSYILLMPPEADDQSLAMTGSFTAMLLSGLLVSRIRDIDKLLPQVNLLMNYGEKILSEYTEELKRISELDFNRAVFLGSGIFKGIACESHLKLQELTDGKIICTHDSFLGFRHGPKVVVNEQTLIVYIFSNDEYVLKYEKDLVKSVNEGRKALHSIGIMENELDDIELNLKVKLSSCEKRIDEPFLSIVSVLPAQILGFFKSLNLGLKPDTPSESGMITRVVQGVTTYPYDRDGNNE
ncbi:MAG: SIS domain-containing protein [Ignavibacteria bacterium]